MQNQSQLMKEFRYIRVFHGNMYSTDLKKIEKINGTATQSF